MIVLAIEGFIEADENHEIFIKYSQESEAEHPAFIKAKEKELQYLEKRQQTTELKKDEENKLIVDIRRLNNEIKKSKTLREEELLFRPLTF